MANWTEHCSQILKVDQVKKTTKKCDKPGLPEGSPAKQLIYNHGENQVDGRRDPTH